MARYVLVGLPNDGTWSCTVCGAVVSDRQLHDTYAHADWASTNPDTHSLPPEKMPQRQYDDQPRRPAPGVYGPTPPQRTDPDT